MTEKEYHELYKKLERKLCHACKVGDITEEEANELRELRDEIDRRLKLQETQQELLEQLKRICINYKDNLLTDNEFRICILEELGCE